VAVTSVPASNAETQTTSPEIVPTVEADPVVAAVVVVVTSERRTATTAVKMVICPENAQPVVVERRLEVVHATTAARKAIFLEIALSQESQEILDHSVVVVVVVAEALVDQRLASSVMKKAIWLETAQTQEMETDQEEKLAEEDLEEAEVVVVVEEEDREVEVTRSVIGDKETTTSKNVLLLIDMKWQSYFLLILQHFHVFVWREQDLMAFMH